MIIPKKSLGQNFLKDKNIVKKILKSTIIKNKNIIEIGAGLGALTEEIINLNPKQLIIIEKDYLLYKNLKKKFSKNNITIINEDALIYNYSKLYDFKIISNLPYNISSKFLIKTIKLNQNITEIVCMIQNELADKFDYNSDKMNKYKFISKYCSKYKILFKVSPKVFFPKPKVESKIVKFDLNKKKINIKKLNLFINLFFINKRKKIKSNKNFKKLINEKIINKRYEDLKYIDILKIYEKFELFVN